MIHTHLPCVIASNITSTDHSETEILSMIYKSQTEIYSRYLARLVYSRCAWLNRIFYRRVIDALVFSFHIMRDPTNIFYSIANKRSDKCQVSLVVML